MLYPQHIWYCANTSHYRCFHVLGSQGKAHCSDICPDYMALRIARTNVAERNVRGWLCTFEVSTDHAQVLQRGERHICMSEKSHEIMLCQKWEQIFGLKAYWLGRSLHTSQSLLCAGGYGALPPFQWCCQPVFRRRDHSVLSLWGPGRR